jgi:hypothetical protein
LGLYGFDSPRDAVKPKGISSAFTGVAGGTSRPSVW